MAATDQSTGPPTGPPTGPLPGAARTPDGTRVYAIGDIHGRADLLGRLRGRILEDAADAETPRLVVVYLGDYCDRGPDTRGVVDMLLRDPLPGFESRFLKGNHEDFLLQFLDSGAMGESWMLNGGDRTLESYGVPVWGSMAGFGELDKQRDAFAAALPAAHLEFFKSLELSHAEGGYLFVHAGVRPGVALPDQDPHDLMWIREAFLDSDADFGAMVVHGHTIRGAPEVRANRIGIDTGAWRSNRLTALVLDGEARKFLHT